MIPSSPSLRYKPSRISAMRIDAPRRPTAHIWLGIMFALIAGILAVELFWPAHAQAAQCFPLAAEKKRHPGVWAELTTGQREFLDGIYAMNPLTPPGLPYGDRAMLMSEPGKEGGVVVFIDGDLACTPMPVPKRLIEMLQDVAAGKINHEGSPL